MYAINHAATALLLKKHFPAARMIWLLIAVQFIELFWVVFNFVGIEYFSIQNSVIRLGYLPWSHSILSTVLLAALAWFILDKGFKNSSLALAFAIGIVSHVILDLLMHEPDIALSPFSNEPMFGLNIQSIPLLTIIVETGYGMFCWWYFKGSRALLVTIIVLNLMNVPFIFNLAPTVVDMIDRMPLLLPTIILAQILYTWYFIWRFSRNLSHEASTVSR